MINHNVCNNFQIYEFSYKSVLAFRKLESETD